MPFIGLALLTIDRTGLLGHLALACLGTSPSSWPRLRSPFLGSPMALVVYD